MVLIDPSVDQDRGVLRIEIPLTEKGKGTVVVETPLEPTEEQLRDMELVRGITIWKSEVDGYAVSKAADEALTEVGRIRICRCAPPMSANKADPFHIVSVRSFSASQ